MLYLSLNAGKCGSCIICVCSCTCSLGCFHACVFLFVLWHSIAWRVVAGRYVKTPQHQSHTAPLHCPRPSVSHDDPSWPPWTHGLTSRYKSDRAGLCTEPFWVAVTERYRLVDRKSHFFNRKASGLFFMCCQCLLGQRVKGSGSEPVGFCDSIKHGSTWPGLHYTLAQETQSRIDQIEFESN